MEEDATILAQSGREFKIAVCLASLSRDRPSWIGMTYGKHRSFIRTLSACPQYRERAAAADSIFGGAGVTSRSPDTTAGQVGADLEVASPSGQRQGALWGYSGTWRKSFGQSGSVKRQSPLFVAP